MSDTATDLATTNAEDFTSLSISTDNDCVWCCKPGCQDKCPQCGLVAFCSQTHLANHYTSDLGGCLPFRIRYCEAKGRYAEAIRDISPTELILRDLPLVVGPSRQQQIVCVECLQPVDGLVTCEDCHLPLCQSQCAVTSRQQWHRSLECPFLQAHGFKAANKGQRTATGTTSATEVPPLLVQLASLTPLRLLLKGLAKEKSSQDLNQPPLFNFYSATAGTDKILSFEKDMVNTLWHLFGLSKCLASEDVVRTAIGQLFNNAKSLEKPGHNGSGLYGRYCMLNHSCLSNAKCIINDGREGFPLDVRAQAMIKKGEEITTRYVGINIGSPIRAQMLREHWSFACQCKRCMDATEMGSYASAIRCYKCGLFDINQDPAAAKETNSKQLPLGLLLPQGSWPATKWTCTSCDFSMDVAKVEVVIEEGLRIIRNNTSDPPEAKLLEHVIQELTSVFHPKHYLVLQVKFVLLKLLVRQSSDDSSGEEWARLAALALSLLETLSILDPGASRNRGQILKDLIKPFMKLAQFELANGKIGKECFDKRKAICRNFAKDLIQCYKFEKF